MFTSERQIFLICHVGVTWQILALTFGSLQYFDVTLTTHPPPVCRLLLRSCNRSVTVQKNIYHEKHLVNTIIIMRIISEQSNFLTRIFSLQMYFKTSMFSSPKNIFFLQRKTSLERCSLSRKFSSIHLFYRVLSRWQ